MSPRLHRACHLLIAHLLLWSVTLVLLADDDVAMLAVMFT